MILKFIKHITEGRSVVAGSIIITWKDEDYKHITTKSKTAYIYEFRELNKEEKQIIN